MYPKIQNLSKKFIKKFYSHWMMWVLFLIVVVFSAAKLHGSSILYFCEMEKIGCQNPQGDLLLFQPRSIRSDDWLVISPILLSQSFSHFSDPSNFTGLMNYRALFIDAPVSNVFQLFRPQTLLFHILPNDFAFAFRWWYRLFMIVFSGYVFTRVLLKIDQNKAFIIGLCLLFTPFILWWNLAEVIYYPLLFLSLFKWYLDHLKAGTLSRKQILLLTTAAIFVVTSFLLLIYPPFQIPLLYVLLFLCFGLLIESKIRGKKLLSTLLLWAGIGLVSSLLVGAFTFHYKEAFLLLSQSSYPGNRMIEGGGYPLWRYFLGPYNIQLLNDQKTLKPYNQSEAAGFLLPFFYIIPLIVWQQVQALRQKKRINFFLLFTLISILFLNVWMIAGFNQRIAKFSLLNFVPVDRAIIGVGMASFIGTFAFLFSDQISSDRVSKVLKYVAVVAALGCTLWTGLYVQEQAPTFIQNTSKIILISLIYSSLVALLAWRKVKLFLSALLLFSIAMSLSIHPIYHGLKPITDSSFILEAKRIDPMKQKRWVVYDSFILSNLLTANGFHTWTGTYLHPQPTVWLQIDPNRTYQEIWNRYAHVYFTDRPENKDMFILANLDSFMVNAPPCTLTSFPLNTNYVVMNESQGRKYSCLTKLSQTGKGEVTIYTFTDSVTSSENR